MEYDGIDRRSSPDTIMLLQEIQKVALATERTATDVGLLRADFAEMKKNVATCGDVENVEKKITEHIEGHRWSVGTIIAAITGGTGLAASIAAIFSIPKAHP